jgi:hypothetical protein
MRKIIRTSLYLSILLFYNLTSLYSSVIHDHQFSWIEDESCSSYIISISQNSDTFHFCNNFNFQFSNEKKLNFKKHESGFGIKFKNSLFSRAPPIVV